MLGSLDHLSGGRVAWNVVASTSTLEARNFGMDEMPGRAQRYDRADEVLEACCALRDSWEDGALLLDKQAGAFADPAKIHYANYAGQWIKSRGPLTTPRSPQGHPGDHAGRQLLKRWPRFRGAVGRDHLHPAAPKIGHAGFLRRLQTPHARAGPAPGGLHDFCRRSTW